MNGTETTNNLCLKNIYQLLGEAFFIPAYQRGYRWSAIQVKELLDDIWEFSQKKEIDDSAFYCLQPIVVVRGDSDWQVVDGQQRLTTLYLILHYLEQSHLRRSLNDAYKRPLYSIGYETRPGSKDFLQNIHTASKSDNIDFFHMTKAYEAIDEWFNDKDWNDNNALLATLLAKPDEQSVKCVKVIWYDLTAECNGNDYAIDVFSRINIGKIPLTNAELVKALFLQRGRFHERNVELSQIKIASEWDVIEKRLHEPGFWHFIYRSDLNKDYPTRIEYIFDLMKGKKNSDETFFTFHKFSADFKAGNVSVDDLWQGVKEYFLTFDEWYRDRELYHLIGFLVDCGHEVAGIKVQAEKSSTTKVAFKKYLKDEISKEVNCQLEGLIYSDHRSRINKVLLLFNIQTLLATKESDARFPFDRYKNERWDIEHIRSQTDALPKGAYRDSWLEEVRKYFTESQVEDGQRFVDKITKLTGQQNLDDEAFDELYQDVQKRFEEFESVDWVDGLGNLTLLDVATNRSYKNSPFPIKRARIIQNDMQGVFVPICTKNTFLKYYSKSLEGFVYWKESDANAYLNAIGEVLADYLPLQGESNGQ